MSRLEFPNGRRVAAALLLLCALWATCAPARADLRPVPATAQPETGWWWGPDQGGTGFALELRGERIFMVGFMYLATGQSVWYSAEMARNINGNYAGTLLQHAGGQTLTGRFKPATAQVARGQVTVACTTTRSCLLLIAPTGAAEQISTIERFPISSPPLQRSSSVLQNGWWWNPQQPGRGFFIEVQEATGFLAAFVYRDDGSAVWSAATAAMSASGLLEGELLEYAGGQALGGPFVRPRVLDRLGTLRVVPNGATAATLVLPDGAQVKLERFPF